MIVLDASALVELVLGTPTGRVIASRIADPALGRNAWATSISARWGALAGGLDVIRRMAPTMVPSSHLPPAPENMTERLLA